jgi:hypothetical protein
VLHFSGLLPKQVYTVWLFKVDPSFPNGPFLGAGTLGVTALSENRFVSSEAGEGEIVRTTPAENLSAFGSISNCFLDETVQLHLVYHLDQMTHRYRDQPAHGPSTPASFSLNRDEELDAFIRMDRPESHPGYCAAKEV